LLDAPHIHCEEFTVQREINLDGGEITVLKALGLSGTSIHGTQLLEHARGMESAEFIETLDGLITIGYVLSSSVNVEKIEDVERSYFRVNPSYARELADAVRPGRRHDEDRKRRRRRG
jgi:hypothetical protein